LLKLFLAGVACVTLGLVLIFHPDLRADPKTISANDFAVGIAPILVGGLLLTLVVVNLFWLSKAPDQPPDPTNSFEREG
jgi:hypothetical protein